MGKIFSAIFGGSGSKQQSQQSSKQDSWNNAWPGLSQQLSPIVDYAGSSGGLMSKLLNGDPSGFNAYKGATGFDFAQDQGTKNILTQLRANGLGNSGAALKSLSKFNLGLQDQYAGNYFQQLLGLGGLGTTAAGILSDAGRQSSGTSQGTSSGSSYSYDGAFGKTLGKLLG